MWICSQSLAENTVSGNFTFGVLESRKVPSTLELYAYRLAVPLCLASILGIRTLQSAESTRGLILELRSNSDFFVTKLHMAHNAAFRPTMSMFSFGDCRVHCDYALSNQISNQQSLVRVLRR